MNKNTETLLFAEEVLKDVESSKIPLRDVCLKVMHLARLLNDNDYLDEMAKTSSDIAQLESEKDAFKNPQKPSQIYHRKEAEKTLQEKKAKICRYVLDKYYELKFGLIPEEIFERTRDRVDKKLREMVPAAVEKFVSAYENLKSTNPEDWSNAVHSCRRILKTVADALYPPNPGEETEVKRNGKSIKIGPDNYINRLMIYIEDHSTSEKSRDIIGSSLKYIGDRLDAIYNATTKGTHADITRRDEAERYIIYTYLLLGDILSL
jgi:hypothetical protein